MSLYRLATIAVIIAALCFGSLACSDDTDAGENDDTDTGVSNDAGPIDDADAADVGDFDADEPDADTGDFDADTGDECPSGTTLCGDDCVDITDDIDHCGDCDQSCPSPDVDDTEAICDSGTCDVACVDDGLSYCDDGDGEGRCVDTDTDIDHCGGCDVVCPGHPDGEAVCSDGICGLDCHEGMSECGDECVDTMDDVNHCGSCGHECQGDAICDFGMCFDGPECNELESPFGGGTGSAGDPHLICTFEHLQNVDDHLTDHFALRADLDFADTDIDFQQDFEPIAEAGTFADQFEGSFDGMGRTISNLEFELPNSDSVGLFRAVDTAGSIENLHLEDITVEGSNNTGTLVDQNNGTIEDATATGVDVDGHNRTGGLVGQSSRTIEGAKVTGVVDGSFSVGGVVGESDTGDVIDSEADVDVEATSRRAGGLVGTLEDGTIEDAHATGDVISLADSNTAGGLVANIQGSTSQVVNSYATGDVEGDLYVGGLAGVNEGIIEDSHATGESIGRGNVGGFVGTNRGEIHGCYATGDVEGDAQIGGFAGYLEEGEIIESRAEGAVTAVDESAGGFVGLAEDRIRRSFATGDVNPQPQPAVRYVGGFAGRSTQDVHDSYALGDVQGDESVGGFVGELTGSTLFSDGLIFACYSFGQPTGDTSVGGLVGNNDAGDVSASYWNVDTSATTDSDGGQLLEDDQFGDQSNFDDPSDPSDAWNFEDTWEMDDDEQRPVLQWEDN